MLSPLWWLPLIVAAVAVVPIWRGARALMAEAAGLQASIAQLRVLRPMIEQVRSEIAAVDPTATAARAAAARGAASGRGFPDLDHR